MIEAAVPSTSSASSFAATPSPAPDAESNDDDEASFAPASPPDEENAAPVVTPFLGERDAAVFDIVPASASIESDEDRLAARSDPSNREKDPVIFEAQAVAAAKAAKAAAASATAAASASASSYPASSPSPALPDVLSSTRLVSYKVNASTADYEPRGVSLNGVKCSVSLAAGSFSYASPAAEATASAESDGGSSSSVPEPSTTTTPAPALAPAPSPPSSDLFPTGLADPTTTPPPTSPVEKPVSAYGSQLIGVDGKPLTITG
jgi:hypothetical protein